MAVVTHSYLFASTGRNGKGTAETPFLDAWGR